MEHSDDSKLGEELRSEGARLQVLLADYVTKVERHLQKRKQEGPSTEDTQEKKSKDDEEEVKLVLTKETFGDNTRKVVQCLRERSNNRVALVAQLWQFYKKCRGDGFGVRRVVFPQSEEEEVSNLLLQRLSEGKELATVLAVCVVVQFNDDDIAQRLVRGGLTDSLPRIIDSHRDEAGVVEPGLFATAWVACDPGKECVIVSRYFL